MTPVQADQSNAVLRDNLRCPYIGLAYDVNTLSEYPSNLNYCHRSQPIALPVLIHQREYCLTSRYSECPMLSTTKFSKLPPEIRMANNPSTRIKLPRWIFPLIVLIILLLGSLTMLIIPEISSAFASVLGGNPTAVHLSSQTPALTRLGFITPSPFSLFSIVKSFTPSAQSLVHISATPTPPAADTSTLTPTAYAFCSAEDIHYFSMSFFTNDVVQIVFETKMDLSGFQVLDAQGKPTMRLNLPDFKLWKNNLRVYSYGTFLRNAAEPGRIYLELFAEKNDKIMIAFTDEFGTHCSKIIIIPEKTAFSTPTSRAPEPTQFIPTPTLEPTTPPPPTIEPPTATPLPPTPTRTPRPSETLPRETLTPTPGN
jgi:hypothetical protein